MKKTIKHISTFTGIGGFDIAAEWIGWDNIAQVEKDPYCLNQLKKLLTFVNNLMINIHI